MPAPLYQAKAEFFRMLGHPVPIRVLELLQDGPKPVRDLLAEIDIKPSSVSQQLAILRRSDIAPPPATAPPSSTHSLAAMSLS
jgi:ArsR family transcriptional regulator, arsenate/arsenite/antimonite-responsive transcriptional repressor